MKFRIFFNGLEIELKVRQENF